MSKCNYTPGCYLETLPNRKLCEDHAQRRREITDAYHERHPGREAMLSKQRYEVNKSLRANQNKALHTNIKFAAFKAYGNACSCCGETHFAYLQLDHINNDGGSHRKSVGNGYAIYLDLKRRGYPPIVQVLCANCHFAKTIGLPCVSSHVTNQKSIV